MKRSYAPGMSVSLVARQEGIAARQPFPCGEFDRQGVVLAVSAGEVMLPVPEMAAARADLAKLQRVLGKKTPED